jgi:hypothetical protein
VPSRCAIHIADVICFFGSFCLTGSNCFRTSGDPQTGRTRFFRVNLQLRRMVGLLPLDRRKVSMASKASYVDTVPIDSLEIGKTGTACPNFLARNCCQTKEK